MEAVLTHPSPTETLSFAALTQAQRSFFAAGHTLPIAYRLAQLRKLKQALFAYEEEINAALLADLNKNPVESFTTEFGILHEELNMTLRHLRRWARPRRHIGPLTQFWSTGTVYSEPYGVALIISPWNYPLQLALGPLIGAIAAGNCAILKPSELSPATSAITRKLIAATYPPEYITVVEGDAATTTTLLQEMFDYIFYTGSTMVGKIIMQAAARHLTPVTLELGGKSPCIVTADANLKLAAKRIAWGKFTNAGQTCVAPDYLLVEEGIAPKLTELIAAELEAFYGNDARQSLDYGRIVNERHFDRLTALLESGQVVYGGGSNRASRYIEPTLLAQVPKDAPVMQEEIFGPILPILTFKRVEEAISYINRGDKPLALYLFSERSSIRQQVLQGTHAGGGAINDTLVHLADGKLPFGGVGASGMGAYHGRASFDTFSHRKGFLRKTTLFDIPLRYAPFKGKLPLIRWLMS